MVAIFLPFLPGLRGLFAKNTAYSVFRRRSTNSRLQFTHLYMWVFSNKPMKKIFLLRRQNRRSSTAWFRGMVIPIIFIEDRVANGWNGDLRISRMDFAITPPNRMELAYASPHRRGHFLVFSHAMDVWKRTAHEDEEWSLRCFAWRNPGRWALACSVCWKLLHPLWSSIPE